MYYYLDANGNQIGPVGKEILRQVGITPNTYIYREGLSTWTFASQLPDLADLFTGVPPTPGAAPTVIINQTQQMGGMRKPSNYLWLGILTTILCCLPFGIVSIVYASKVDSCWARGDYDEAYEKSNAARNWGIASAVSSLVIAFIYIVIIGAAL